MELTQQQRDIHIKRNKDYLESTLADFEKSDSHYHYEMDEINWKVDLYFDEKISDLLYARIILTRVSELGFNYILENNRTN